MKRILVAPLNWGLGHVTRCIPIIEALDENGFEPILASDGAALQLLKKEFPQFRAIELPSYDISYPKKGPYFKWKLLLNTPRVLKAIKAEHLKVESIIKNEDISGIISDNRFGVFSASKPCVYMTHQLQVLSGNTTKISSKIHQNIINKFDECWVPDRASEPSLSGILGHSNSLDIPIKYLGIISRLKKQTSKKQYDLLVLLSGPEPQRSKLENQLLQQLDQFSGKVLFIKGKIENEQKQIINKNITSVNFMQAQDLQNAINSSEMVLSRSGYSTILDLAKLGKKAFFIPTPGQYEQEYLAKRLEEKGIAPFCIQEEFTLDKLKDISKYNGFDEFGDSTNFEDLFRLF